MRAHFHESIKRSFVKALTFRSIVLCSDGIIIFWITHRYDETLGVIALTNLASTFIFFLHERFWNSIHWGKHKVKS